MRAIITAVASLVLAPFLATLAVEVVKPWLPPGMAVLKWMTAMYEAAAFPWVVAGATGLLVGLWLDKISAVFDGRHPITKAGKAKAMAVEASLLGIEIENSLSPMWGTPAPDPTDYVRAIAMFGKISALGIPTPSRGHEGQKPAEVMRTYAAFLRQVSVPMEAGNLDLARAVARSFVR
ncbi:hypothetical protein [Paracoccus sp. SSJ]|uniref:hypothetical protein n=1 Tax=Paracoccus sp. SSJ TaxID=3050636 RepID=UPI002551A3F8|nr:hypothetical protein [Paracoccus sp. SSJ]MDK8874376.1 hypothetical protein [Paracoccus sp. SSJ]